MYHLRLIKGLSYCGLVKATREHPDIFIKDKLTADLAIASGYFRLVENIADTPEQGTAHLDKVQLEEMKLEELKRLAADLEVDTQGLRTKSDYVEALAQVPVVPGDEDDENGVEYE